MIAAPQQDLIEVYVDQSGDVAMRQLDAADNADLILIAPENVEMVIQALRIAKRAALEERRSAADEDTE